MAATAIVIPVPEAEALIGAFRREHTAEGAQGMGAHVTLLYPFTDTALLDEHRAGEVAEIIGTFPAFDFALTSTGRFPENDRVLCLRPEPDTPFRALTQALVEAFPEHQPYGGKYRDAIPHATVAMADDEILSRIARTLAPALPVAARATEAALVELDDASALWRLRQRLPLGRPAGTD